MEKNYVWEDDGIYSNTCNAKYLCIIILKADDNGPIFLFLKFQISTLHFQLLHIII